MDIMFWLSLSVVYYVYDGYLRLLKFLSRHSVRKSESEFREWPSATVLLTVYNEAEAIEERIRNILAADYPKDRLELLVASDGSTDGTDALVREIGNPRVKLISLERCGKTEAQNQAVKEATGEILVFTDARTRFDRAFLKQIILPFSDPSVGGVDGHLLFISAPNNPVSEGQGRYWRYELQVRQLESDLNILVVASGACMAIRRFLLRQMDPSHGEDCVVPLDVALQGYRFVHSPQALAYDHMDHQADKEFKTRVRMTLRNWQGTLSRRRLLNPFRHPGYAWALWSHKLLRWLSPLFLILMTLSSMLLAASGSKMFQFIAVASVISYMAGFIGWQAERRGLSIPVASAIYSFLLANLGFLVGLWRSLRQQRITAYRS
ncbi:MAG: glycosyltransferase [Desulfomonile tiedjei]|uniref:Glycosyltransferase n=1 Tax=Desulfomonile tiedjei TaxID=2358 RepID=A0A9D6V5Q6_9BACT|nr:glycosyltransferase [Desulfomonile tiedjei]